MKKKRPLKVTIPNTKANGKSWEQTVILISLDGFRAEYLKRKHVPTLQKLVKQSISSNMHPVFPTSTFPNHYSMVTGMYPYIHGIVNNKFYDPALRDTFSIEKSVMKDPKWWKTNPVSVPPLMVDLEHCPRTGPSISGFLLARLCRSDQRLDTYAFHPI